MSIIKIVGIDPGLAGTGIGVVQGDKKKITGYSFGSIETHPDQATPARLHHIYSKTIEFLTEQSPDLVVIEDIYSLEKYPGSGIMLGKVSGVLLLAAFKANARVEEVAVREVKMVVCGNGGADKKQVERSVRSHLGHGEPIRPFHASDALGLAITGFFRYGKDL